MDPGNIESQVKGVFARLFRIAESSITATTGPEQIENWDSLNHMSLSSRFGERVSDFLRGRRNHGNGERRGGDQHHSQKARETHMKKPLSDHQVEMFHRNGFVVVPSFYNRATEIEPIQHAIYDIIGMVIRRHGLVIQRPRFQPETFDVGFDELISCDRAHGGEVYDAVKMIPAFVRLAASEKNEDAVRQLRQTDMPGFISRGYGMRIDLPQ